MYYNGWTITHEPFRPVTGTWKAVRHGVSISAGSKDALKRMIDQKYLDEIQARKDKNV